MLYCWGPKQGETLLFLLFDELCVELVQGDFRSGALTYSLGDLIPIQTNLNAVARCYFRQQCCLNSFFLQDASVHRNSSIKNGFLGLVWNNLTSLHKTPRYPSAKMWFCASITRGDISWCPHTFGPTGSVHTCQFPPHAWYLPSERYFHIFNHFFTFVYYKQLCDQCHLNWWSDKWCHGLKGDYHHSH